MIKSEALGSGNGIRILVQANKSMGWQENFLLAVALGGVSIGFALVLAWLGYWMVLPFAGAEFIVFVWCLQRTLKRLDAHEIITIESDLITLEWGSQTAHKKVKVPRQWSRLRFRQSESPFEVGLLTLRIHNKSYKLGTELGKKEKIQLFKELRAHFSASQIRVVTSDKSG